MSDKIKRISGVNLIDRTAVTDSADGLRFTAVLKVFNRPNSNGDIALPDSYDKFVNDYYTDGGYNVPLCFMHDPRHIVGTVEKIERDDDQMSVTCRLFSSAPDYNYIADLVRNGTLGGVSDGSLCRLQANADGTNTVAEAQLLEVSLVTVPAEIAAHVKRDNTVTEGFGQASAGELSYLFKPSIFNNEF